MEMAALICRMGFIFSCTCLPGAPLHPLLTPIVGRVQPLSTVLRHCVHEGVVPEGSVTDLFQRSERDFDGILGGLVSGDFRNADPRRQCTEKEQGACFRGNVLGPLTGMGITIDEFSHRFNGQLQ